MLIYLMHMFGFEDRRANNRSHTSLSAREATYTYVILASCMVRLTQPTLCGLGPSEGQSQQSPNDLAVK